jgi:peroxiredoxin
VFKKVSETFSHKKYYDVLLHYFLINYIENDRHGLAGIEDLVADYLGKCKTQEYADHIRYLKSKWNPLATGMPAPAFTLLSNKGNEVSLSNYRGKYVFIEFWATWCGPCKSDIPHLKKLIDEFASRNIVFISISGDKDKQAWLKMLQEGYLIDGKMMAFEEKANWVHLHDPVDIKIYDKYLLMVWPTYCLIGPDGKFVNSRCVKPSSSGLKELFNKQPGL